MITPKRRSPRRSRAALLLFLPLLGGCGTIASFAVAGSGALVPPGTHLWPLGAVYCGVAMDLHLIRRGTPSGRTLAAIDLPLSLCLDTLLLPLTVPLDIGLRLWRSQARPTSTLDESPVLPDVAPVGSG